MLSHPVLKLHVSISHSHPACPHQIAHISRKFRSKLAKTKVGAFRNISQLLVGGLRRRQHKRLCRIHFHTRTVCLYHARTHTHTPTYAHSLTYMHTPTKITGPTAKTPANNFTVRGCQDAHTCISGILPVACGFGVQLLSVRACHALLTC